MTDKLKELMELNKAVDVLCAAVDKENNVRREKIQGNIEELWNDMWDDIEKDILPVIKTFDKNRVNYIEGLYPFYKGWKIRQEMHSITFYTNGTVYLDYTGGRIPIHRDGYWNYVLTFREQDAEKRAEILVTHWKEKTYPMIIKELEKWAEKIIKDKIKEKEKETTDLERRLMVSIEVVKKKEIE